MARWNMMHPRKDEKSGKTYWDPIGTIFIQGDVPEDVKIGGRLNTGCEFQVFPAKPTSNGGTEPQFE